VISVVVPTYNRAPVLARCLDALHSQAPDEIVVVDDGSTDDTSTVLAERPWVRWVKQPNRGRAAAKNAGVDAASGDVVLFVDDDVIATPGLVERHAAFHASSQGDGDALLGRVTWSPEVEVTRHMHWLEHGGPLFAYDEIDDPDDVSWKLLYTCNVSLKRVFLEPFDVELPIFEDSELAYRLTRRGLRLHYDASALGHHLRTETPARTAARMHQVGVAAAALHRKWPELYEPPPPIRAVGRVKAAAASVASRLGVHRYDDQLDSWRAARAYARGYASEAGE
jgi:glycosyltransferase involved in cell wall biosynthesis